MTKTLKKNCIYQSLDQCSYIIKEELQPLIVSLKEHQKRPISLHTQSHLKLLFSSSLVLSLTVLVQNPTVNEFHKTYTHTCGLSVPFFFFLSFFPSEILSLSCSLSFLNYSNNFMLFKHRKYSKQIIYIQVSQVPL